MAKNLGKAVLLPKLTRILDREKGLSGYFLPARTVRELITLPFLDSQKEIFHALHATGTRCRSGLVPV
jgi:hypothetical protein